MKINKDIELPFSNEKAIVEHIRSTYLRYYRSRRNLVEVETVVEDLYMLLTRAERIVARGEEK